MKKLIQHTEILKHLPRTGWLHHHIENPETVAAHSWQMAMMAMQLSGTLIEEPYDFNKLIKMCLCHDLGESIIGDITPSDAKYKDKQQAELKAVNYLAECCDMPEVILLFEEYEKNETKEAKLAHDLDLLDMYAQSLDYEKKIPDKDLSEFRQTVINKLQTPLGSAILKDLTPKS